MTRRRFAKQVSGLAKRDGLTSKPRKVAVEHALGLWDGSSPDERVELVRMLSERLDGATCAKPPGKDRIDDDIAKLFKETE